MAGSNSWNGPLTRLNAKGIPQTRQKIEENEEINKMKKKLINYVRVKKARRIWVDPYKLNKRSEIKKPVMVES